MSILRLFIYYKRLIYIFSGYVQVTSGRPSYASRSGYASANGFILGILYIGLLFSCLKQPTVIEYLLAGILVGPYGLNLIEDQAVISSLGDFGVVLLLFFIGMESSPQNLVVIIFGTLLASCDKCCFSLGAWAMVGLASIPYYID